MDEVVASAGRGPAKSRRRWYGVAAVGGLLLLAVVAFWFQPQKLILDEQVLEPVPTGSADQDSRVVSPASREGSSDTAFAAEGTAASFEPLRGEFISRDHPTRGVALVLAPSEGERVVRLEGLETDNGPDLYVYLSASPAEGDEGDFDDDFVSLGRLKGNRGDQNYELSTDVDLTKYSTVVIWCDRFDAAFGAADLT